MNKVLILEDEKHTREFLEQLVGRHPLVNQVLSFENASDAIRSAGTYHPQLALLDIELEVDSITGIDAARLIYEVSPGTEFIFVTGYGKYALQSFEVHPYDYILKPIHKEKLLAGVGKLLSRNQPDNVGRLAFRRNQGVVFLNAEEIIFLERSNRKTLITCSDGVEVEVNESLQLLQEQLPQAFLRVHESFIVNRVYILEVKPQPSRNWLIRLRGSDQHIPLSRGRHKELKDELFPHCHGVGVRMRETTE